MTPYANGVENLAPKWDSNSDIPIKDKALCRNCIHKNSDALTNRKPFCRSWQIN